MYPTITGYHPTYAITGGESDVLLLEVTLDDFALPEEFISIICGVLRRRGYRIDTIGDLAQSCGRLAPEDVATLIKAGVLEVKLTGMGGQDLPKDKPLARIWSWQDPVETIIQVAAQIRYPVPPAPGVGTAPTLD